MTRLLVLAAVLVLQGCAPPLARLSVAVTQGTPGHYHSPKIDSPQCASVAARLEASAKVMGITILYDEDVDGGMTDFLRTVWLHPAYITDVCGRVEVLAHELAHVLQPTVLYGDAGQLWADAVSYLIVRRHAGYDPIARYAPYVANYKAFAWVLTRFRPQIELTARVLMGEWPQ
jgi:hypothetical protein